MAASNDVDPREQLPLPSDCPSLPPGYVPDWRWKLATRSVENQRPVPRSEGDDYVAVAVSVLRQVLSRRPRAWEIIQRRRPHVLMACDIFLSGVDDIIRQGIEAALVTNATYKDIADFFAVEPAAVEWYARLFFDVRQYLGAPNFIEHYVIRPARRRQSPRRVEDLLNKLIAQRLGWKGLSNLLSGRTRSPEVKQEISRIIREAIRADAKREMMFGAESPQAFRQTMRELRQLRGLDEIERKVDLEVQRRRRI